MSTDFTTSERHEFIDGSISTLAEAYNSAAVKLKFGNSLKPLQDMADNLVVPNIVDGRIEIPRTSKTIDSIPIVALRIGETLLAGDALCAPTAVQMENAEEIIETWEPKGYTARQQLQQLSFKVDGDDQRYEFSIGASATALALAGAKLFGVAQEDFAKPIKPIGIMMCRPLVVLHMPDTPRAIAEPYLLTHELVHVAQKTQEPLRTFGSQLDVRNDRLRDELEAYHMGAHLQLAMEAALEFDPLGLMAGDDNRQIAIEATRLEIQNILGQEKSDPFGPNKMLVRKLDDMFGLQNIIHESVDFDKVYRLIMESQSATEIGQ